MNRRRSHWHMDVALVALSAMTATPKCRLPGIGEGVLHSHAPRAGEGEEGVEEGVPDPLLDAGRDLAQDAQGLLRVGPDGGLARQHESIRPLPHHIRDVGHLWPRPLPPHSRTCRLCREAQTTTLGRK